MSKVLEKRVAEIIIITLVTMAFLTMSSCGSSYQVTNCPAYAGWSAGCGK